MVFNFWSIEMTEFHEMSVKDKVKFAMDVLRKHCLDNNYNFLGVAIPNEGGEAFYRTTITDKEYRTDILIQLLQTEQGVNKDSAEDIAPYYAEH
jgi:hypothetical protein